MGFFFNSQSKKNIEGVIWESFGVDDSSSKDYRVLITANPNKSLKAMLYDMKNWGSNASEIKMEAKNNLYERILSISTRIALHIRSKFDILRSFKANLVEIIGLWIEQFERLYPVSEGKFLSSEKFVNEKVGSIFTKKNTEIEFYGEDLTLFFNNSNPNQKMFSIESNLFANAFLLKTDSIDSSLKVKEKD